ncbi:YodC family protein [Vibrio vulnificus]|uniref:YodC family protein n=1 Tax=Vibrio vulnificus TaxID=672 RepID=UPI001A1964C2|nr:DUF2158 domain-containing protein [Vibrio vulnificus]EGQ8176521.1 DUF2158 domain-containing protein [Vibrio vulnificus]EGR0059260.1 DUF2158 domain-containing protein [Vibrio vulnificus]EKZ9226958.1 DUF2158 domain-containing protein [Vibrio vulnificus]ELC9583686.1 DUF2158 domain-containing protein [Vibrio vulnificus]ELK8603647.1 DUF2158 domain-containing protein [Vibrio vulnificus]
MSEQAIYAVGDIVKLKSGGPDMTVKEVITKGLGSADYGAFSGSYRCQWFAGKKLDNGVFPQESLLKVSSGE